MKEIDDWLSRCLPKERKKEVSQKVLGLKYVTFAAEQGSETFRSGELRPLIDLCSHHTGKSAVHQQTASCLTWIVLLTQVYVLFLCIRWEILLYVKMRVYIVILLEQEKERNIHNEALESPCGYFPSM